MLHTDNVMAWDNGQQSPDPNSNSDNDEDDESDVEFTDVSDSDTDEYVFDTDDTSTDDNGVIQTVGARMIFVGSLYRAIPIGQQAPNVDASSDSDESDVEFTDVSDFDTDEYI